MKFKNLIPILILVLSCSFALYSQEVSIILKNGKVIIGNIIEENSEFVKIDYELGELKLSKQNIDSISYNPFISIANSDEKSAKNDSVKAYKFTLKDPVVVYLKNGKVVAGLLLAKSLNMIMLQTESGNLTIPKRDLSRIEYISSEYAERGEVVIAFLNNGQRFEGNIYFEDSKSLTLDTDLGRLTLPKNKLRTIEYTGVSGVSEKSMADQYESLNLNKRYILPRYDVLNLGYISKFGSFYAPGFGIGYNSRFNVAEFEGLNLSFITGLSAAYFTLDKDNLLVQNRGFDVSIKGGALITTIMGGGQINIFPQSASFYDFYLAPAIEGHLIYTDIEQKYPSFPQLNSAETKTEFKFGLGIKLGMEFLFDTYRMGLEYHLHQIFGSDGFNQLSVTFVKPLF